MTLALISFFCFFSSLSIRLLVFHPEYHCILLWLIRLTNFLKMCWSHRLKRRKIHGLVEKLRKLNFLTPYWYFKWFNTDLLNYIQYILKIPSLYRQSVSLILVSSRESGIFPWWVTIGGWLGGSLHVSEDRVDIKNGGEDEKRKGEADTPFHTMGRGRQRA